ncbi:hypothetical protein BDW75DRAFT_239770 [Aspergillus navahoensis]
MDESDAHAQTYAETTQVEIIIITSIYSTSMFGLLSEQKKWTWMWLEGVGVVAGRETGAAEYQAAAAGDAVSANQWASTVSLENAGNAVGSEEDTAPRTFSATPFHRAALQFGG